jgi:hypothetical protein
MDFYIINNVLLVCSATMIVLFTVQKILLKKFFQHNTVRVVAKSHKRNVMKAIFVLTFITSASPLQAADSQGFVGRFIDSAKGFWERVNPFASSVQVAEGKKRLEHYDASKNEKLETNLKGPNAEKAGEKKQDYGKLIESEEFIGEAYPKITEAAKESAPTSPKDKELGKTEEENSKVKKELTKEESKEDIQNKIYADIENETVSQDQHRKDETQYEQEAQKKIADKMDKTNTSIVSEQKTSDKK